MSDSIGSAFPRRIAFTGLLSSMRREEAFSLVRSHGRTPSRGLTKKTDALVVGALGWPLLGTGGPSKSLALAKSYGVSIVSERQFLEWAGLAPQDDELRTYTAGQIAALVRLPLDVIEQLSAFGLLDCRGERYRFRDLTAARQLAELLTNGVALSTITRSLHEIRKWLPDAELSKLRLFPASSDALLVEQLRGVTDKRGQFVLPVLEVRESPDELFEQAQAAEALDDGATAERLYRKVMRVDPSDATAAFNLGNLLRRKGQKLEAEMAYRAALGADGHFAEAWYNLADLLDDQGQPDKAMECLEQALVAEPGYADALFNLALLHQRKDHLAQAAESWRAYLALDQASEWASRARRALKFCEMQLALL
ncbi:MAG: tetratricopeptide repeat protein [Xanthobacteraceae bacterium]